MFLVHPARRAILMSLYGKTLSPSDISHQLKLGLNGTRYHLRLMKKRGLIEIDRRSRPQRCRLSKRTRVLFVGERAVIAIRFSEREEILLKFFVERKGAQSHSGQELVYNSIAVHRADEKKNRNQLHSASLVERITLQRNQLTPRYPRGMRGMPGTGDSSIGRARMPLPRAA